MQHKKYKIHVVAGPTASGKTEYAIKLAQKEYGELINIDSRQIYRHLDIGTNKGKLEYKNEIELSGIDYPVFELEKSDVYIYLLSFLAPDERMNAVVFRELVYELIPKIVSQGFVPILVGGSGLYLDMIMRPDHYAYSEQLPNEEMRERLNKMTVPELQEELASLDISVYKDLNSSDQNNPHRLIRWIERLSSPESGKKVPALELDVKLHYMNIGIDDLTDKINDRVDQMFANGFIEEVKKVLALGYPEDSVPLTGIGYKQVISYLHGELTLPEAVERTKLDHRQYAKRQITWFNKYLNY